MAGEPEDDWETVTDPVEIQKVLGKNGANKVLGLTAGGPASGGGKAASEGERKAAFLATRLAGSVQQINAAGKDAQTPGFASLFGGTSNVVGNFLTGSDRQRVENAQLDLLDSALTLGTGAAYTKEQLQGYRQSYFPQLGDSDETVADKKKRLDLALQAARIGAGSAASQIDEALKAAGFTVPQAQAKGGDQQSGAAGAIAGSGGTPPTSPSGGGPGEVVFADQMPDKASTSNLFTPEQQKAFQALAQNGGSEQQLAALAQSFGVGSDPENLKAIAAFYRDPKNAGVALGVDRSNLDNVKPVDPGDGGLGAAARGAGNALTLGFLDEAGALADTVTQGGTYDQNLDRRRGQELYDEQNNGLARFAGQVVGGLPLGALDIANAGQAARTAGIAAVRGGVPATEARALSNRIFASRTALEAAGLGGAYGFGEGEDGLGSRVAGAGIGAAVSGALGGAVALGGGRFARAMAARRAAQPASQDAARRSAYEPSEASRLAAIAQEQNIAVLPQDIADGPMIGRMTAGQAQTPFGTNTIRRATDNLYQSFSRRVGEVGGEAGSAADVGAAIKARSAELAAREGARAEATSRIVRDAAGQPVDLTGAGIVAQRGATRWMEDTAERANQLYARVPIEPTTDASLASTRASLRELNQGLRSNPELSAIFSNPRLQALERAVNDEVDPNTGEVLREARLSWQDLQEFRTRVGDALDDPRLSEKIASRQLRQLYGALSDDMRATAEAQGPDALRAWRRANDFYDGRMKRINNTLSAVLGERRDRSPAQAMSTLNGMLREGSTGDAGRFSRVLRSMSAEDAQTVRATIVNEAQGGRQFDAKELASSWGSLSERGKSALLPQAGLRSMMDDAAERAAASQRDPLAAKSGQQVVAALEDMAKNRGDVVAFRRQLAALSPDEANGVRSLLIHRMGQTKTDAVRAGDGGEVFSISHFLKTWEGMTDGAKLALFGSGQMRDDMNALATLAKRVQGSEALRGHSNTGAVNSLNATTGGLGAAALAAVSGHPIVAAGLAAPAAYQRLSAEILTSPRLLRWLARAPKKPNLAAQRAHIQALKSVARSEPAIAQDVLALQRRLADAFGGTPARLAADERRDRSGVAEGQNRNQQRPSKGLQP